MGQLIVLYYYTYQTRKQILLISQPYLSNISERSFTLNDDDSDEMTTRVPRYIKFHRLPVILRNQRGVNTIGVTH